MWKPVRRKIPPKYEIWWWKTQRVGNRVRSPIKDILLAKRLKHPPIRRSQLVVGIGHGRTHSVSLKVMRKTLVDAMTHCSCCSSSAFLWSFSQNFSQSLRIAPFCFSEIFWKSLVGKRKCGWNPKNPFELLWQMQFETFSDNDSSFWEWKSRIRITWQLKKDPC